METPSHFATSAGPISGTKSSPSAGFNCSACVLNRVMPLSPINEPENREFRTRPLKKIFVHVCRIFHSCCGNSNFHDSFGALGCYKDQLCEALDRFGAASATVLGRSS